MKSELLYAGPNFTIANFPKYFDIAVKPCSISE